MRTAARFHQLTKYSPETIDQHPPIDWTSQPKPFKEFRSETRVDLKPHWRWRLEKSGRLESTPMPRGGGPITLAKISALLQHTNGVTMSQENGKDRIYFRAAPSAGALYPTEIYLVLNGVEGAADGIYNYLVRDNVLAPLIEGDFKKDLLHWTFQHPAVERSRAVVLLSAIFKRSSWRYMDRAYRRILLDTGHVLGNLVMFAPEVGVDAVPVAGFHDGGLNSLMLFDENAEGMLVVCPLVEKEEGHSLPASHGSSPSLPEKNDADSMLLNLHFASGITELPKEAPPRRALPFLRGNPQGKTFPFAADILELGRDTSPTILRRRSTRQFSPRPMPFEDLASILLSSYAPTVAPTKSCSPWQFIDPGRLETYIAVQNVGGLPQGLYVYDVAAKQLRLLQSGDPSRASGFICITQELAAQAAAVVFQCAHLDSVLDAYGDRGYRYLGLDAGHLGHRMNLFALKLGHGATGIGGYFDDHVNALFGLPKEMACIYVTCLGTV